MADDCLYIAREDGSWAHSLFCPAHQTRLSTVLSSSGSGWPTSADRDAFTYATGQAGLDTEAL